MFDYVFIIYKKFALQVGKAKFIIIILLKYLYFFNF